MVQVEPFYDIVEGEQGDLMLVLTAKPSRPRAPRLMVDGSRSAVMARAPREQIVLTRLPTALTHQLTSARSVEVCEMDADGDIAHAYTARIEVVPRLPAG